LARITINGVTVDPAKQHAALGAANLLSADASKSNFILVQTKGPVAAAQRQQLADLGVEILEYAPEDTYICRYMPADLSKIRALPFVAWVNVYLHVFKISPRLRPAAAANALTLAPVQSSMSKERVTVEIVLHKDSMTDAVRNQIASAAGMDPTQIQAGRDKIRLIVEQRRLDAIAAIDEVHHIEKYYPPRLANNIARGILNADQAQAAGTMRGEGQIVCVADTGFDRGAIDDVHPAFEGRVLRLYALGRANASDPDGHGTHVCGSVLGDLTARDGAIIRGTAPAARLVMQSVLDSEGGLIPTASLILLDCPLPPVPATRASRKDESQGACEADTQRCD
jgi:serine protease AprX